MCSRVSGIASNQRSVLLVNVCDALSIAGLDLLKLKSFLRIYAGSNADACFSVIEFGVKLGNSQLCFVVSKFVALLNTLRPYLHTLQSARSKRSF